MADEKPQSSPIKKALLAVVALAVLGAAAFAFLPIKSCPACDGTGKLRVVKAIDKGCPWCNGSGKIPFLKDVKNAVPGVGH
jgi:hypothetical protein